MKKHNTTDTYDLITTTDNTSLDGVFSSVLGAVPMAIAKPFLDYKRITIQEKILLQMLETNARTREDIMRSLRELAAAGELTPEITQYLFAAYNQALIQISF